MKGIAFKMASKMNLPSAVSGGGGGGNEHVDPLLDALFEWLFLDAFSNAIFEPSDAILESLGTYFGSLWGAFL